MICKGNDNWIFEFRIVIVIIIIADELWWAIKIVFDFIVMDFYLVPFSQFLSDLIYHYYVFAVVAGELLHSHFCRRIHSYDAPGMKLHREEKKIRHFWWCSRFWLPCLSHSMPCNNYDYYIYNRYEHQPPIDAHTHTHVTRKERASCEKMKCMHIGTRKGIIMERVFNAAGPRCHSWCLSTSMFIGYGLGRR